MNEYKMRKTAAWVAAMLRDGRPEGCICPPNPGAGALPSDNRHSGMARCPRSPQKAPRREVVPKPTDLVLIRWEDTTNIAAWIDRDEVQEHATNGAWICENIGRLVYEDEHCYVVASRCSSDAEGHVGLVERIPRRAVLSVTPLTTGADVNADLVLVPAKDGHDGLLTAPAVPAPAPVPPVKGDPLLVSHLEGNKRSLRRYTSAVSDEETS